MASPQLENGYTKIANEILDSLIRWHLSSYEFRIILFVLRKTYGWNKKEDWISLSQFCIATKIKRPHVCRALRMLQEQRMITKGGTKHKPLYRFQKDFDMWKPLPKGARSHHITKGGNQMLPKGVIRVVPKGAHTKESITKETITKENRVSSADETHPSMKRYNENEHYEEPTIDANTGELLPKEQKGVKNAAWVDFRNFWKALWLNKRGFEPEISTADKIVFFRQYKLRDKDEVRKIAEFYLTLEKSQEYSSMTACFSTDTINQYKKRSLVPSYIVIGKKNGKT